MGKAIGGGIPCGAFGMTAELADRVPGRSSSRTSTSAAIGGTLAGNALSLAAMRATLTEVLTDDAYATMLPLGQRWADGVAGVLERRGMPWHVTRLGCSGRVRVLAGATAHRAEAAALRRLRAPDPAAPVRAQPRLLLTPFHNMALMAPTTTAADVDQHTAAFDDVVASLLA